MIRRFLQLRASQSRAVMSVHALATTQRLREARERGDAPALVALLPQHCLKPNVAGIHEMELYARARAHARAVSITHHGRNRYHRLRHRAVWWGWFLQHGSLLQR